MFDVAAKTGQGVADWAAWLSREGTDFLGG